MIKFLFLFPLLLCGLWAVYLKNNGYTMSQGRKGFVYILIFSGAIGLFYTGLIWLTHR